MKIEDKTTIFERLRTNRVDFSLLIEEMVLQKKISYMEAIIKYCEMKELDFEDIKPLVVGTLKSKLENEAKRLHML
jgi:hypothetical protein